MIRFCQIPNCSNRAVWAVNAEGENGAIDVCVKHYGRTWLQFEKLGFKPKSELIRSA